MPALTSGRYHVKWTKLASLPAPMYGARAAVQDKRVYIAGGKSIQDNIIHQMYAYDVSTDHWSQLPPSGQCKGNPCIIGGKLAIIGGTLSHTNTITNKVSTFDESEHKWISYYPDLLSVRKRPGVITHKEHVIVAGGIKNSETSDMPEVQSDIEILNWVENTSWKRLSVNLPVPMSSFAPIIADCQLYIVGYWGADMRHNSDAYMIPIVDVISSSEQNQINEQDQAIVAPTQWINITAAFHHWTSLVPHSSPPATVGGRNKGGSATDDISVYILSRSWRKVASLSSARSQVAVAAINDNAIIVFGGYTKGGTTASAMSSCVDTVELGQAKKIKPTILTF